MASSSVVMMASLIWKELSLTPWIKPLIVSFELGILNTKLRSIVIWPNGFPLSFMFSQTIKKRNPFYFARVKCFGSLSTALAWNGVFRLKDKLSTLSPRWSERMEMLSLCLPRSASLAWWSASNRPTRPLVPRALLWLSPQVMVVLTIYNQSKKISNLVRSLQKHVGFTNSKSWAAKVEKSVNHVSSLQSLILRLGS